LEVKNRTQWVNQGKMASVFDLDEFRYIYVHFEEIIALKHKNQKKYLKTVLGFGTGLFV
jgi:hypothetical protein